MYVEQSFFSQFISEWSDKLICGFKNLYVYIRDINNYEIPYNRSTVKPRLSNNN